MKPTLGMEEGKTSYPVTIAQPVDVQKNKSKFVRNVAVAVIGFVLVAVVIVVAVYFGIRSTKDTYQEAWRTFRDQEGRYIEERVNKSKDMTEIDVPNSVQIIHDYKNGISVQRFTDVSTKIRGPCYVRYINSSQYQTYANTDQDTDDSGPYNNMEDSQHWRFTNRRVPSYLTSSPRVQEMCKDTDIFWTEEVPQSSIQKRAALRCYLSFSRYLIHRGRICRYDVYLCYDGIVYVVTYWELWCGNQPAITARPFPTQTTARP